MIIQRFGKSQVLPYQPAAYMYGERIFCHKFYTCIVGENICQRHHSFLYLHPDNEGSRYVLQNCTFRRCNLLIWKTKITPSLSFLQIHTAPTVLHYPLGLMKDEIMKIFDKNTLDIKLCKEIAQAMSKNKVAVVPNRVFERHKLKRSKRKFFIHQRSGA